jgi:hypothetical protein
MWNFIQRIRSLTITTTPKTGTGRKNLYAND